MLFFFFLILIIVGCGTDSNPNEIEMNWGIVELNESQILSVSFSDNILFAGTENGAYKLNIESDIEWEEIGLHSDTTDVTKIISLNSEHIFATLRYDTIRNEDKVLFESTDGGSSWEGWTLEITGASNSYSYLYFLDYDNNDPNVLYGYSGYILRSNNTGQIWEQIFTGNVSEFLYVSKDHSNQIWTGGWNNTFSPYLAKSSDGGENWKVLNEEISFNTDSNVYAVAVHKEDEEAVLAGFGGATNAANVIRKSEDGGGSWETVLNGYNIRSLKNSDLQLNRVYASGRSPQGQLFVAISDNYGDSWEIETYEESPAGIQTNDMVVTEVNGNETIYFGTNKGVYSLSFE